MDGVLAPSLEARERFPLSLEQTDIDLLREILYHLVEGADVEARSAIRLRPQRAVHGETDPSIEARDELGPRRIGWSGLDELPNELSIGKFLRLHSTTNVERTGSLGGDRSLSLPRVRDHASGGS